MKNKITEIICVLLAALFIIYTFNNSSGTDRKVSDIKKDICDSINIKGITERNNSFFKKTFNVSPDEFEGYFYYSSEDVMDVRELLFIKLFDEYDAEELIKNINSYYDSKMDIFAGYAPEQGDLLKNKVFINEGNVLFIYVGNDTASAEDVLRKAL